MRLNSTALPFQTLDALLPQAARDDRHITFIDGESDQRKLSFAELRARAMRRLARLRRQNVAAGDAVVLYLPDNEQFLELFWACLLGGIVPVPLAPGGTDENLRKLMQVFGQLERGWVSIDAGALARLEAFAQANGAVSDWLKVQTRVLAIDDAAAQDGVVATERPDPDQPAFIQFSSGSTGQPKGVVLTHRNLATNIVAIGTGARYTDQDKVLSWMPLSHDMGLIGFHLTMLAYGISHAIMRTELFARRPLLWLDLASQQRMTVLCSPNFGFQHYLKQFEAKKPQGLDLSSIRLIFNGAEPISAELCRRFLHTLAPHGLASNAILTVYGLAEASLAVSFPPLGSPIETVWLDRSTLSVGDRARIVKPGAAGGSEFVKVGKAVLGTELRVADEKGQSCGEDVIGHVLIRGDNVTHGYYRNAEATARARSAEGWLDTGDLGLIDGGDLVITGRAKDLIIVNGQNYYPHDIEQIAERVPGVDGNRVVAASVRRTGSAEEELALFVLHRSSAEALAPKARELRDIVAREAGLEVAHVIPVPRIPKTTSGKLQRYVLVQEFEKGDFDAALAQLEKVLRPAEPEMGPVGGVPLVEHLLRICATVVPDRSITAETNLLEINLNSLTLARIHEAIEREFPGRIDVEDLLEHPTLGGLAQKMGASLA